MTRILRAFWHRTRKVFVPLTVEEVCRRADISQDEAMRELKSLGLRKLTQAVKGEAKTGSCTWHLTDYGKHIAAQIIKQQEGLKP